MALPVALQLYSVRDVFYDDIPGTLKKVREMGYDGVEMAGLGDVDVAVFKKALEENHLPMISAHVPVNELLDPERLKVYKELGCEFVAIPWMDFNDIEKVPENLETIKKCAENAKNAGLKLLYHNHNFEFNLYEGKYILDTIYETVPADRLQTEVDTCWVKFAGEDPVNYLKKYAGRAPLVHLKDFVMGESKENPFELIGKKDEAKKTDFRFTPVGYGCQDIPAILEASKEVGAGWVIVEQDRSEERPTLEAAEMSVKYVKSQNW